MKRCPKCNRSFPEDSQKFCTVDGGLLIAEPAFDPSATMRATSADLGLPTETLSSQAATSRKLPNMADTILSPAPAPTGPASTPPPPPPAAAAAPTSSPLPPLPQAETKGETGSLQPAKQKSKLPLVLGILAVLLILGVGGLAAAFFFVIKPRLDQTRDRPVVVRETPPAEVPTNTNEAVVTTPETTTTPDEFVPPPDTTKFENSNANLDGKLAEHYLDFSFYYPNGWEADPRAGVAGAMNFVKVERRLPPDFTQENFAVGWYTSQGTFESDTPLFPRLVELVSANLSKDFPEYRKVSEGPTKINSMDAYEFRFVSLSKETSKGDIQIWGRVVFLPSGTAGQTTGATLNMLATSLAPELAGVEDVGDKGQIPVILESFRFEKKQ